MGIKDLSTLIKKYSTNLPYREFQPIEFRGKTFAVDISIYICGFVMSSQETWLNRMVQFLLSFKKWGITPIIIFDGKNVPIEKLDERESRKTNQQSQKSRLEKMQFFKEQALLYTDDILPVPIQEDFKELFKRCRIPDINIKDPEEVILFIQERIDKAMQTSEGVQPHHKQMTRQLVTNLGYRYIEAYGEAESLAASMAYSGLVDGVVSRDTDSLVYGCPLLVDFKTNKFHGVYLKDILTGLDITMKTFIDMCICLGCDYNKRMPKVGPAAIYTALKKYGNIDEWKANSTKEWHLLKVDRCRAIFRPYSRKYQTLKCNIRQRELNIEELDKLFSASQSRYTGQYIKDMLAGNVDLQYLDNWESIID